jgi:hypothetical protein
LALLCAPLAACQTRAERQAQLDAQDNDTCLSYGAKHGSDAYVRCRTDLQRNRAIELAATQPVFADPLAPGGRPDVLPSQRLRSALLLNFWALAARGRAARNCSKAQS